MCTQWYTQAVNRIGIRELRDDLSNQVKRASRGEVVEITIGGEPMARITPMPDGPAAGTLDQAYATGRIVRAPRHGQMPPPPPEKVTLSRPGEEILREIREDRI